MNFIHRTIPKLGIAILLLCSWQPSTSAQTQNVEAYSTGGGQEPQAFRTQGNGWTNTSSGTSGLGAPATLTWSIVPNGTILSSNHIKPTGSSGGVNTPSNLISFLDGVHHSGASPGGADLTQRTWWGLMNSAFQRWDAVSGVTFNYESQDDGLPLSSASGALGTRGDHRISGHSLDGQTSPTILAFNFFPNNADMVIDTDEINRWSNATNNYRLFRNMLMHEIGHGLGLNHVESFDVNPNQAKFQFGTFLMEPILASGFDGPQFDDILGIHRLYGDHYEEGTGNDTYLQATTLSPNPILAGQTLSVGTDANDLAIAATDIDFVSIDSHTDLDFFRFSISSPQTIDILLTPLGPTYDEGGQGSGNAGTQQPYDASAKSNLTLALYDTNGTSLLEFSNNPVLGASESITNHQLLNAGDYYVRVGGQHNAAQFYQLDITVVPEPTTAFLASIAIASLCILRRRTAFYQHC